MKQVMPQEIEVWYLIPALRKELAKIFVKKGLNQKKAAELLGITEAAVSQYVKGKRGVDLNFSKKEVEEINKTALEIYSGKVDTMKGIYKLCVYFRNSDSKVVCDLHKKNDSLVEKNCDVCF